MNLLNKSITTSLSFGITLFSLLIGSSAWGSSLVFLDFDSVTVEDEFKKFKEGTPTKFVDSALVNRLDMEDGNGQDNKQEIANMIMNDIKSNLESLYSDYWITFTKEKPTEGKFKTLDFFGGVKRKGKISAGTAPLNGDKAWIFVDVWADTNLKFWRDGKDGLLDKTEVTNTLSKTAAHELGHLFGLGENNSMRMKNEPGPDDTPTVGAIDTYKPSSGVMAQGTFPDITNLKFKDADARMLREKIGGKDKYKPTKQKTSKVGDVDDHGTNPDGVRDDLLEVATISPGEIINPDGDGTDELLSEGVTSFLFPFVEPDVNLAISSAFLSLGIYNYTAGAINLELIEDFGRFDLTDLLLTSGMDGNPLNQSGGLFTSLRFDLESFLGIPLLEQILADGEIQLDVTVNSGFDNTVSLDYIQADVFMQKVPEPTSTLSLIALGTLGSASTLKRKLKSSKSLEKELEKVS